MAAGIAPSRTAVLQDPDVLRNNPHFRAHLSTFHQATARPRSPLYPAISNILQRYFSRVLAYRDVDVPAEAAKADAQINRLLELGRSGH
jgi:multiple sugar transport system substrate-binding protein